MEKILKKVNINKKSSRKTRKKLALSDRLHIATIINTTIALILISLIIILYIAYKNSSFFYHGNYYYFPNMFEMLIAANIAIIILLISMVANTIIGIIQLSMLKKLKKVKSIEYKKISLMTAIINILFGLVIVSGIFSTIILYKKYKWNLKQKLLGVSIPFGFMITSACIVSGVSYSQIITPINNFRTMTTDVNKLLEYKDYQNNFIINLNLLKNYNAVPPLLGYSENELPFNAFNITSGLKKIDAESLNNLIWENSEAYKQWQINKKEYNAPHVSLDAGPDTTINFDENLNSLLSILQLRTKFTLFLTGNDVKKIIGHADIAGNVSSIHFPISLEQIGTMDDKYGVFEEKRELSEGNKSYITNSFTEDIQLPPNLKIIGNRAFANRKKAKLSGDKKTIESAKGFLWTHRNDKLEYKLEYIGDYAFFGIEIFELDFSMLNNLKYIGKAAFYKGKYFNGNTDTFIHMYNNNMNSSQNHKLFDGEYRDPTIVYPSQLTTDKNKQQWYSHFRQAFDPDQEYLHFNSN